MNGTGLLGIIVINAWDKPSGGIIEARAVKILGVKLKVNEASRYACTPEIWTKCLIFQIHLKGLRSGRSLALGRNESIFSPPPL